MIRGAYVRKFDIIPFLNAQLDPVQNQLEDTPVRSLGHTVLRVQVELLLPLRAEGCQGGAGKGVHERSMRLVGTSFLPDGDQLVLAALVLVAKPIMVIADAPVRQRSGGSKRTLQSNRRRS